jgi:hypothetical protein
MDIGFIKVRYVLFDFGVWMEGLRMRWGQGAESGSAGGKSLGYWVDGICARIRDRGGFVLNERSWTVMERDSRTGSRGGHRVVVLTRSYTDLSLNSTDKCPRFERWATQKYAMDNPTESFLLLEDGVVAGT